MITSKDLKSKNYSVNVFQDFKSAIDFLTSNTVDLIISDMNANSDINGIYPTSLSELVPNYIGVANLKVGDSGLAYVVNEEGVLYVFKSGRAFQLVARNDLADGGYATPVIAAGRIYLRTLHHLYCLGKSERIGHGPARRRHW